MPRSVTPGAAITERLDRRDRRERGEVGVGEAGVGEHDADDRGTRDIPVTLGTPGEPLDGADRLPLRHRQLGQGDRRAQGVAGKAGPSVAIRAKERVTGRPSRHRPGLVPIGLSPRATIPSGSRLPGLRSA